MNSGILPSSACHPETESIARLEIKNKDTNCLAILCQEPSSLKDLWRPSPMMSVQDSCAY